MNLELQMPMGPTEKESLVKVRRVQSFFRAAVLISYPRNTPERILIDPACYEGPGTAQVIPPKPLGRMARKLQEIASLPVERRPMDLYAALAEVAR